MFINILIKLIESKGVTKNKLLTDLNLGKNSFINWEQRGTTPGGDVLIKIADYFDITVDYLLGRTEQKEKPTGKGELSEHEAAVINAYRNHPEMQPAVDKLLGIYNEDYVQLYTAASSKDNRPDEFIIMPKEKWEKIKNTPDTDDSLM